MIRKAENKINFKRILIFPAVFSFIICMLILLAFSILINSGAIGNENLSIISWGCLAFSIFICSLLSARLARYKRFICGIISSFIMFLLLIVLCMIITSSEINLISIFYSFLIFLLSGFIGSLFGSNIRTKKYKKR